MLDFSNRTFEAFILESFGIDVYAEKYEQAGNSKANRLREFWRLENNFLVGQLIAELLDYWRTNKLLRFEEISPAAQALYDECGAISQRLIQGGAVEHLDALESFSEERSVQLLERSIRESVLANEPEEALDRLHTFAVRFMRDVYVGRGINYDQNMALHSLYGQYVRYLRTNGFIESEMTERILNSYISLLDQFNYVRNQQSLAHDNPLLNQRESHLIISGVLLVIRFLRSIEEGLNKEEPQEESDEGQDDWEPPF